MRNKHKFKSLYPIVGIYAGIMLYLLFWRETLRSDIPYSSLLRDHINLFPFSTIIRFARVLPRRSQPILVRMAVTNLFGNILLFVPMGWFLPQLHASMQRFRNTFLISAGIITIVEILQLVLLVGWCDIDDLLLNLIGSSLGFWLYHISHRAKK